MKKYLMLLAIFLSQLILTNPCFCQTEEPSYYGYYADESNIVDYDNPDMAPKEKEEHSVFHKIIMWLPNRLLDIWDIFKFDVGVGPAFGATVRVTDYAGLAFRGTAPLSVRVGNLGRRAPFMLESSNEIAAGVPLVRSMDRKVCPTEIGAGADALLAGAYAGVCPDEILDFIAGIFFIDLYDDDI